jgi:hypothetical protein
MVGRIALIPLRTDRELVAKAAAESVYGGVGGKETRCQNGLESGATSGWCWRGSQTVGDAPDENRLNTVGAGDLDV